MNLSKENLKNTEFWNSINVVLPKYDIDTVKDATTKNPTWLHVGGGNIFRAFIARVNQRLLNQGLTDTGIIVCGTMDYENFERVYKPFDNLSIICDLKPDGNTGYEIIGNITEAVAANYDIADNIARLNEIASNPSLQIISFTITEKGYALRDADGKLYPDASKDMENGPSHPLTCMGFIASLLYERFKAGAYPLALVSMDNCSHNGDKLRSSVLEIIDAWAAKGFVDNGTRSNNGLYVADEFRSSLLKFLDLLPAFRHFALECQRIDVVSHLNHYDRHFTEELSELLESPDHLLIVTVRICSALLDYLLCQFRILHGKSVRITGIGLALVPPDLGDRNILNR